MGSKKSKAPPTPDYAGLARQDAAAQKDIANQLTAANRPDQVGPYGSIDWQQGEDGSWRQNVVWDPEVKASMDAAMEASRNALQGLGEQGEFNAPDMVQFDPTAGDKLANDMYESVMGRVRPEQAREQSSIDLKLRQQGLQPGTAAYDRAMQNLMTSHGDVAAQAGLTSTQAGYEEARQRYAQQLAAQNQEYSQALQNYTLPWERAGTASNLVNSQYTPSFEGFGTATGYSPASMTGAANQAFQADMGKYNSGQSKKNSMLGAGSNLGSAMIMK